MIFARSFSPVPVSLVGNSFEADKPVPVPVSSNPDPAEVFFAVYVYISSGSVTRISDELWNSPGFSPKDFIRLYTAAWLTFKILPVERNPGPPGYNINASFPS